MLRLLPRLRKASSVPIDTPTTIATVVIFSVSHAPVRKTGQYGARGPKLSEKPMPMMPFIRGVLGPVLFGDVMTVEDTRNGTTKAIHRETKIRFYLCSRPCRPDLCCRT